MLSLSAEDMGNILRAILAGKESLSDEDVRWVRDIRKSLNHRARQEPALAKNDAFIRSLQEAEARVARERPAAA